MPLSTKSGRSRHQRFDREHHAIGRRAVHLPAPLAALDRTQRVMQRERMARRALLAIGRDDRDLAERLGGRAQALDAVRENAVVVGDQQVASTLSRPGCVEPSMSDQLLESDSSDSSDCTVSAPRATALRSPPLRCSSTF